MWGRRWNQTGAPLLTQLHLSLLNETKYILNCVFNRLNCMCLSVTPQCAVQGGHTGCTQDVRKTSVMILLKAAEEWFKRNIPLKRVKCRASMPGTCTWLSLIIHHWKIASHISHPKNHKLQLLSFESSSKTMSPLGMNEWLLCAS